jgi:nucleoside-diphosphate-sugar epimerase
MKVFLTGASGFVGQHVLKALLNEGHEVMALARSEQAAINIRAAGAAVVRGDMTSLGEINLIADCEAVVHAAAILHESATAEEQRRANVEATQALLKQAHEAGARRFVAIGAAAVVMSGRPLPDGDEKLPLQFPDDAPYIKTKAEAERLVIEAAAPGFETIVLRPGWIWGPGDPSAPEVGKAINAGRMRWIDGGDYPFVTTHVENVAEAAVLSLTRGKSGSSYFILDEDQVRFKEWVIRLQSVYGVDASRVKQIPRRISWLMAKFFDGLFRILRMKNPVPLTPQVLKMIGQAFVVRDDKAREELGYRSRTNRESGLRELTAAQTSPLREA